MVNGMDRDALIAQAEAVARHMWGEPNRSLSSRKELRWGSKGARSLDLEDGIWCDHAGEHEIAGGGVLELVMREKGVASQVDAVNWLTENGFEIGADKKAKGERRERKPEREAEPMQRAAASARSISKTYDYTDGNGNLIYQVVRFEPKAFTQRRPYRAEEGVWAWGLKGGKFMRSAPGRDWIKYDSDKFARWPNSKEIVDIDEGVEHGLYRLPELREALAEGVTVFLVEGEKDTDNLIKLDVPASTNSGGAKHWNKNHAAVFEGADVVIIIDNDKAGRQGGERRAKSLRKVAKRVRILDLAKYWPEMPEKADITDWIAAGGTVEKLFEMVQQAPDFVPVPFASKFGALWFRDIDAARADEHSWLVEDWLSICDRSLMYGATGSGKSFLAIDVAMCVARGLTWFGKRVQRGGVIYQAGEGAKGIIKRFRAYRRHFDILSDDKIPLAIMRSPIDLYHSDGDTSAFIAEIKALAEEMDEPLHLVVIDTLATATAGADENSGKDMSTVMANIARISKECECHVMLVHHKNASGERPRGHTSVLANIDNAIEVQELESGRRVATNAKQKDGAKAKAIDFELLSVFLGIDEYKKQITSCVVVPPGGKAPDKIAEVKGFKLTDKEALVFRALLAALADYGVPPPAGLGLPKSITTIVDYAKVKAEYAKLELADDDDVKAHGVRLKQNIHRARHKLMQFGIVGTSNPWIWWTGKPVRGFKRAMERVDGGEMLPSAEAAALAPDDQEIGF